MLIIGLPALIGADLASAGHGEVVLLRRLGAGGGGDHHDRRCGVGAPLAVWCVMPAIVTIVLEAPWLCGVGLSVASLLVGGGAAGSFTCRRSPPTSR